MANKIALVTGANQGIGFAIVEELCKRGVGVVYLGARDETRGKNAVDKLKQKGVTPTFLQLEVTDENSVKTAAGFIKRKHGGLDILINNAGVITQDFKKTTYEDSKRVIDVNYYGVLTIQKHFFPILNKNARVVNISSDCGHISNITNQTWIERLIKKDLNYADVDAFVQWFLDSVNNNTLKSEDFHETSLLAYRISKVALSAVTRVQQEEVLDRNISVNSIHPGFVTTNMTRGTGLLTMEESSKAPVFLALDADESVKGKYYWFDAKEKPWVPEVKLHCVFELFESQLREAGQI